MRRFILALSCSVFALVCHAAEPAAGRWQGVVNVPGNEFDVVVDLAKSDAGAWIGSVIASRLNIKGAPLSEIVVTDTTATFAIAGFGRTPAEKAEFSARFDASNALRGDFRQGGNTAAFALTRVGQAQVELPPHSTAVAKTVEGQWVGDYELGGYPRHITITMTNRPGAAATVEVIVVGKKTTNVPIDLVVQDDDSLRIESNEYNIIFEGKLQKKTGDLKGIYQQGPFDLPLTLHRPG